MERYDLELILRAKLSEGFRLYNESHWVFVLERDGNVYVSYWPSSNRIENNEKTGFDVQISKGVCYILHLRVEKSEREKGNGRELLRIFEDFCSEEFLTKRFQTTPSGIAKNTGFYEHRGYVPINQFEVAKDV